MRLPLLVLLLLLPAFFAAGEVALLRLRPSRVEVLVEEGLNGAQAVQRLQRRLRRALMLSQLGATLALVAIGWVSRGLGRQLWPDGTPGAAWLDAGLFLVIVLAASLLAGLMPKAWVLNRPEPAALRLAPLLEAVMRALSPLLNLLEGFAAFLLKLVGLTPQWDSLVPALSAGELETLIESGRVTGLFPDERNILEGVFALRDTQVREVMVPRSGMVTLPVDVRFAQLMEAVHQTRHARFPVIGQSLDDVRGLLDLRQLAEPIALGRLRADSPLEPYLQPAVRVLETSTLAELMPLIRSGHPLLLVVDEHGGTEGLVTAADLTEEIVGDELQEDSDEPVLEQEDGQADVWMVDGDFEIFELNRQLNLDLPEADDHHTLAGFLLERLQHIPSPGEALRFNGLQFEITAMQGPRIERVRLVLPTAEDPQG